MVTRSLAFAVALAALSAPVSAAGQSVDDAMDAASQHDIGVARADLAAERARLGVTEARASSLPSVDLNASFVRNRDEIRVDGRVFVNRYDYDASLTVRLELLDPTSWPERRAAMDREGAAAARASFERSAVRWDAARAFFDVIEERGLREVRREELGVREESLASLTLLEEGGDVRAVDVERARLEVLRTRAALLDAEQRLLAARLELEARTGWSEVDVDALEAEELSAAPAVDGAPVGERVARSMDASAAARGGAALRWQRAPSVSLTARTLFGRESLRAPNGVDWTLTLSLQWALFDPALGARIRAAEVDLRSAELLVERFDWERALLAADARADLEVAAERVRVARESVPVAEEVRRVTLALLEAGEATPLELAEADSALALARTEEVRAEAAWWRADTERRWLAGELEGQ